MSRCFAALARGPNVARRVRLVAQRREIAGVMMRSERPGTAGGTFPLMRTATTSIVLLATACATPQTPSTSTSESVESSSTSEQGSTSTTTSSTGSVEAGETSGTSVSSEGTSGSTGGYGEESSSSTTSGAEPDCVLIQADDGPVCVCDGAPTYPAQCGCGFVLGACECDGQQAPIDLCCFPGLPCWCEDADPPGPCPL